MLLFIAVVFGIVGLSTSRNGIRFIAVFLILCIVSVGIGKCIATAFSTKTETRYVIEIPMIEEMEIKNKGDYFSFYSASFNLENVKSNAVEFVFVDNAEPTKIVVQDKTYFYDTEKLLLIDLGLFTSRIRSTEEVYTIYLQKKYALDVLPLTGPKEGDKPVHLAYKADVLTA